MRIVIVTALLAIGVYTSAHALEVKGLKLGKVYSHQALANILGTVHCPKDPTASLQYSRYFSCASATTYLGMPTQMDMYFRKGWMLESISVEIPEARLQDVQKVLIFKYGQPDVRFSSETPCDRWNNVQDTEVRLCWRSLSSPHISFLISKAVKLDPDDI